MSGFFLSVSCLKRIWAVNTKVSTRLGVVSFLCLLATESVSADYVVKNCDEAAVLASRKTGVPIDVLRAITRTETGRVRNGQVVPWPWTVNVKGEGYWFDTDAQARAFAYQQYKKGVRSFDVGCFQLNHRWHGNAFPSLKEMFDPQKNAQYAAHFLNDLHGEFEDWTRAVGAYHSRTPKFANKYLKSFEKHRARLSDLAPSSPINASIPAKRENRFPLLQSNGARPAMGSLMPTGADGAHPLANFLKVGG